MAIIWVCGHADHRPQRGGRPPITASLGGQALTLAWIVALVAMLGSLYFSEVAHFIPCEYCWYQRIAMYPLVLILGIAAYRQDTGHPPLRPPDGRDRSGHLVVPLPAPALPRTGRHHVQRNCSLYRRVGVGVRVRVDSAHGTGVFQCHRRTAGDRRQFHCR